MASANPKWRPGATGFALSVTADKLALYGKAGGAMQFLCALKPFVRATASLTPGKIIAWRDGRSPR